jgi:glycerophosphoryl diester phosphodiesterase
MKHIVLILALTCSCGAANKVVAIAHRGEHIHHPENTMAAYQSAIDAGADYIEVDVRTTADGKLILMHDGMVDRTTNGKGAVKDMTFAQIRALDVHGEKVPTFDEALERARGKIGVYVDSKQLSAADLVAALEKFEMQDKVVVYGGYTYLKEVAALRPKIRIMPESVSVAISKKIVDELHPQVIAFSGRDFTDEIIAIAKAAKADIYVDRFGEADSPAGWQDAIDRGATGIQTNKPAELVEYLRSRGYHK